MGLGWIKPAALIRRQAADLLARVDRDPSQENINHLERWRASDPRHADALARARAVLNTARLLNDTPAGSKTTGETVRPKARSSPFAVAASIAAALIVIPLAYGILERQRASAPLEVVMLITAVGEIRPVPLSDGSRVTLDTASAVRIELTKGRRRAVVEHGRARFMISKRDVPFTVQVGSAGVQIDKGTIDVSRTSEGMHIDVIAGSANVLADNASPKTVQALAAIDQAATGTPKIKPLERPAVDWTSGRLSFEGARLAEVVTAANRYTKPQIVIADPSVADLRVTGVYKSGDAAGLARSLASAFHLQLHRDNAGNLRLDRDSSKP